MLRDTIQPFPTFSEIYVAALHDLHNAITTGSANGHRDIHIADPA